MSLDTVSISRAYNIPVVAIGAPNATNQQGLSSGSVEIFEMKSGEFAWTQILTPPGNAAQTGAQFGYSVEADGFMVAVGSPLHNRAIGSSALANSGAVFVYSKATTTSRYVLTQTLYGMQREEMFGNNVRVKGVFPFSGPRVLLVGAPNSAPDGYEPRTCTVGAGRVGTSSRSWFPQELPSEYKERRLDLDTGRDCLSLLTLK
mmetsp:Transcript_14148/g.20581  ORF Transcript_14148/g.20581 Transcript_14148/m.20581 type:complete len:203 (-) Transcript_14148:245-853(-)